MKIKYSPASKKRMITPINILIGVLFLLFLISLGLIVAINFRPLYYADIKWLGLEKSSGLAAEVIRQNYDALIDYNSPFYFGELSFPSLPASATGISHFVEVKLIFNFFYIMGAITFILLIGLLIYKKKKDDYQFLLTSSITTVLIPILVLLACIIDFERVFLLFHTIVFSNEDWLFDPVTDPIITLLPETFFMQCAFIIIGFVLIGSLIQFLVYLHKKKSNFNVPLLKSKVNYYY